MYALYAYITLCSKLLWFIQPAPHEQAPGHWIINPHLIFEPPLQELFLLSSESFQSPHSSYNIPPLLIPYMGSPA